MTRMQIGGFSNLIAGSVTGLQLAGFMNTAKGTVIGSQMSGFLNISRSNSKGLQLAGFSNILGGVQGAQVSGFLNKTEDVKGLQLAGFINKAKEVKGVQLSVINVADSVTSGTQVGLVNISKNGLLSPGLESDDVIPYGLTFRSGQDYFYTVLSIGVKEDEYWAIGAGFGSRLPLSKQAKAFVNPELRWQNLNKGKLKGYQNNNLVKLNLNVGYQLNNHLYLTAGPSVNFFHTTELDRNGNPKIDLVNNPSVDEQSRGNSYQVWIGYNIGISF